MTLSLSGVPLFVKLQNPPVVSSIESLKKKVKVYPNPTSGEVFIDGYDSFDGVVIKLKDCLGQEIKTWEGGTKSINISNLPQGIYYLSLYGIDKPLIFQLIKVD